MLSHQYFGAGRFVASSRHWHLCLRQYFCHLAAQPPATILQDTSPDLGETQKAAVRPFPALPSDRQIMVGPRTSTCPSWANPIGLPIKLARASRDRIGSELEQGCPGLHEPSISFAATPDKRMRGPSAHQIGPSPSQTRVGVQEND